MGSSQEPEVDDVVPQLAPDCDWGSLTLSPAEGFLLSRVDGRTSWKLLRSVGGLSAEEVDACLARWVDEGVLRVPGREKPEPPPAAPPAGATEAAMAGAADAADATEAAMAGDAAEAELDPSLDLPLEQQRVVLEFEAVLERPYHEILGVPADADGRVIKRSYFRLSKEFHPDRYFRRKLGAFGPRIERVFRKINEAYEMLSDPSARAEMERTLRAEAGEGASPGSRAGGAPSGRSTPHAFSLLARIGRERRRKARHYFEQAQRARQEERWVESAQNLRLAIACDPRNEDYREPFAEVVERANALRAERHRREADSHYDLGEYGAAYRSYEDALHYRPYDLDMCHRAAKLAWRSEKDLKAAKEYAARACEIEPEVALHRKTLGQIYAAAELWENARRELEHALRLDGSDEETKLELRNAKRQARRSPRGGS